MPGKLGRRLARCFAVILAGTCAAAGGFAAGTPGAVLERQIGVGYPIAIAFSTDGSLFLGAYSDGTLRLWDVATGRGLRRIMLEGHRATAVAISPDASHIHCIEGTNVYTTFETESGRVVDRVVLGASALSGAAIALSPCGRYGIPNLADHLPSVWDLAGMSPLFQVGESPEHAVHDARFSPDARYVAVHTASKGLWVWDILARAPILRLLEPGVFTRGLYDFSPDSDTLAFARRVSPPHGSQPNVEILVWDIASGAEPDMHRYRLGGSPGVLRFLPDGQSVLVMHNDSGASVISIGSNQVLDSFVGNRRDSPDYYTEAFEVSPLGLAPWYRRGRELSLFSVAERKSTQVLHGHLSAFNRFAVSRDCSKIAVVPYDSYLYQIWPLRGGHPSIHAWDINSGVPNQVSLSANGDFVLFAGWNPTLFNTATGKWTQSYGDSTARHAVTTALASDASLAVISRTDGSVDVWPTGAAQPSGVLRDYGRRKMKIALSDDDRFLATGAEDGVVSVWDLHTGRHIQQFRDLAASVISVALSPDASRLVAGDKTSRLLMWDVQTGAVLAWHRKAATATAFDRAGERVAVANFKTISILDGRNGAPMREIVENAAVNRAHIWQVELLQFSPDGTRLYSASTYDGVKQWVLDPATPRPGRGGCHSADGDCDGRIDLGELMRVIQFYASGGYFCADPVWGSEDAYHAGPGSRLDCVPHDGDYRPADWRFSLEEVLRVVQLYRFGGYTACADGEDGYCPAGM